MLLIYSYYLCTIIITILIFNFSFIRIKTFRILLLIRLIIRSLKNLEILSIIIIRTFRKNIDFLTFIHLYRWLSTIITLWIYFWLRILWTKIISSIIIIIIIHVFTIFYKVFTFLNCCFILLSIFLITILILKLFIFLIYYLLLIIWVLFFF